MTETARTRRGAIRAGGSLEKTIEMFPGDGRRLRQHEKGGVRREGTKKGEKGGAQRVMSKTDSVHKRRILRQESP